MERGIPHMGEIIRNMRKQKGYTQDALAQAAGVSVQAVSKWETGQSMPDVALLPSIADFLEVAIDALFGRSVCQANREPAEQAGLSFPHDGRLRVVQYLGDRMMDAQECTDGREIRLYIEDSSQKADIEIQGSARISGAISGAVHASGDLFVDGSISGEVKAGGNITCEGNISGAAQRSNFAANRPAGFDGAAASFKGIKVALSDMGGKLVRIFSTDRTQGNMDAFFRSELPDDEVIRVVQMQGRRIMSVEESSGEQIIRLSVEHLTQNRMNVEVYGSAEIHGNIGGNAHAGETMTCGDVGGNAQAEDSLTCGNVAGNAEAGDGLTCAQVGGSVRAGDSVHVGGDVHGDVSAGESVSCAAIGGNVKADKVRSSVRNASGAESALTSADVEVSSEQADMIRIVRVKNGREIPAEEYEGEKRIRLMLENAEGITVQVQGVALMEGDIQGDVYAYGSLVCEDVEGDVYVQGQSSEAQVRCGAVSGSVTAKNISLTCGDVDGDLNNPVWKAEDLNKLYDADYNTFEAFVSNYRFEDIQK